VRPVNNSALRTDDKKLLGDLAGWVHYIKNTRIGLAEFKKRLLEKGEKLIRLINAQYHLKNSEENKPANKEEKVTPPVNEQQLSNPSTDKSIV
jgi:hypothetical protein